MEKHLQNKSGQYLLKFAPNTYMGEEDFLVTSCNETAYKAIKIWPYWQHFALNIFGPKSSGKSHLAQIWVNRIQKSLPRPIQIPFIAAQNINLKNINKFANEYPFLVIENLDSNINEEAFFHLYNHYNVPEKFILFTSELPPSKLLLKLPDLKSRLNIIPTVEILQPDDAMLTALIAKLFNDRQIIISQDILDYILKHTERSFNFVARLIEEIDGISWTNGRAVSIPIVRDALNNLTKNQQLELFI
ncbi:MAG: DnaA/Hda family protein [Acetobacter sp.]|nr:DnaA/Hda family protein [Acetobacter sp.]